MHLLRNFKNYSFFILCLIVLCTYNSRFFFNYIITHWDRPFVFDVINGLFSRFIWRSVSGFWNVLIDISQFSWSFYELLWYFNISYQYSERYIFFIPSTVIALFWSYLFSKNFFKNNFTCFFVSIIFCYNTYFLTLQNWHNTLSTAFSFFPFLFLCFDAFLKKPQALNLWWTILLFMMVLWYEARAWYIIAIILWLYFLFNLSHFTRYWKKLWVYSFIWITILILLQLRWLLPLSHALWWDVTTNEVFNRGLWWGDFMSLANSFTLFHPFWWFWNAVRDFQVMPIPLYFWLIPFFAWTGFFVGRKNKYVQFFWVIALFGIFLSKQTQEPFGWIYERLYYSFPWFNAFREASKFYFLVAVWYSVLIGSFVEWFFTLKTVHRYSKYAIGLLIASLFLVNTVPLITWEVGRLFVPRSIPQDYHILNTFLMKDSSFWRTLSVPRDSRWMTYTNTLPKISLVDELWKVYKNTWYTGEHTFQQIEDFMSLPNIDTILDKTSIRYIILPLVDTTNDDDFYKYYGNPYDDPSHSSDLSLTEIKKKQEQRSKKLYNFYYDILKNVPSLQELDIWTKEVKVFENTWYQFLLSADVDLRYTMINPTKYTVVMTIPTQTTGAQMKFLQSFHQERKLYPFSWPQKNCEQIKDNQCITQEYEFSQGEQLSYLTKQSFFEQNHTKIYDYANQRTLDRATILKHFPPESYRLREDGSLEVSLVLYFRPQSRFYLGLIISWSTLLVLLLRLGRDRKRRRISKSL